MTRRLHVIAACTKRKRYTPNQGLQMRSVSGEDISARFDEWDARVNEAEAGQKVRALDLYAGDHWWHVRRLADIGNSVELEVSIWVCSAGLGLISAETLVPPYAATFSLGHVDAISVAKGREKFRRDTNAWWQLLQDRAELGKGQPRTVTDLAAGDPDAEIIVIAAGEYLRVMSEDLQHAGERLSTRGGFTIFSADAARTNLSKYSVPISADYTTIIGGSLHSLNARTATFALSNLVGSNPTRTELLTAMSGLMESAMPRRQFKRSATTDEDVLRFIRDRLKADPRAKKTRLLRELRDSNRACEQNRFGQLFEQAKQAAT